MTLDIFRNEMPGYIKMITDKEKSQNTIDKYSLALRTLIKYAETTAHCEELDKDCFIDYGNYLKSKYKPKTVNVYIVGLNGYLHYLNSADLCIKSLNIQNNNSLDNCMANAEYKKILDIAKNKKNNTAYYAIRVLACTGMRIHGLKYITVSVIKKGSFTVTNKGKTRNIVIPEKVCAELREYCNDKGIKEGYVFHGRDPKKLIHRTTVSRWLKSTATIADVDENKAFPHNLRHLFARNFMETHNDLAELADILGHTKIETTRIYTRTSLEEKRRKLDKLDL